MALKVSFLATGLTTRIHGNYRNMRWRSMRLKTLLHSWTSSQRRMLSSSLAGFQVTSVMICSCCHRTWQRRYPAVWEREGEMYKNLMTVCTLTKQVYKAKYLYIIGCMGGVQTLRRRGRCQSHCLQHLYSLASAGPANHGNETHIWPMLGVPA